MTEETATKVFDSLFPGLRQHKPWNASVVIRVMASTDPEQTTKDIAEQILRDMKDFFRVFGSGS